MPQSVTILNFDTDFSFSNFGAEENEKDRYAR